jgi:hypothetical protein
MVVLVVLVCGGTGAISGTLLVPLIGWWFVIPLCILQGALMGSGLRFWYDVLRARAKLRADERAGWQQFERFRIDRRS